MVTEELQKSGVFPQDWKVLPLEKAISHLIDFRGKTPRKLGMDWGGGNIPALSANNVKMGFIDFKRECYLGSEELYDTWMTKGHTQKNDIIFTMEAPLGNAALIPDSERYILSQRVILLRCNDSFSPEYLHQFIMSDHFQDILDTNSTGTTAKGIQQKRLIKLPLLRPPLPEQKKIARILSSVDSKLALIDQQITTTQTLKKGLMQKLFTQGVGTQDADGRWQPHTEFQETELGRVPLGWEINSLSEVCLKIGDGIHSTPKYVDNSEFFFVNGNNLKDGSVVITESTKCVDKEEFSKHLINLDPDTILMSINGTIGNLAIYRGEQIILGKSAAYMSTSERMDRTYLFYLLATPFIREYFALELTGTTIKNLSLKSIRQAKIPLPKIIEQQEIARILSTVDRKLGHLQSQKNQTQQLKKGLMQKLLTGQIRVQPDPQDN